jgi:hypothetical protein
VFEASSLTKAVVVAAQITMVPFLFTTYMIKPQAMHRFVGYLEETAVKQRHHLHRVALRYSPSPAP